jgi:hypothetical protein
MSSRYLTVVSIERLLSVERYCQAQQASSSTHAIRKPRAGGIGGRADQPDSRNGARAYQG